MGDLGGKRDGAASSGAGRRALSMVSSCARKYRERDNLGEISLFFIWNLFIDHTLTHARPHGPGRVRVRVRVRVSVRAS